jgi:desulfoferrodoxin (superoxide reductase-like protein)
MHLPDEDPGSFSLFVDWVYRSTVPHCNTRDHFVNLFKLYVFAEKMYSNELANRTMDRIRFTEYHNPKARVTVPLTCYVYKNTPEDSPLRQYCIHDLAYNLWNAKIESTIPDNHNLRPILECSQTQNDMVLDFFGFLRNNPTGIDNHTEDSDLSGKECEFFFCNFHRHGVKEICYTARSAVDSQNWPKGQSMDDFGDFSY